MTTQNYAENKSQLLALRVSLMDQLAVLRGGPIGRVAASEAHFGHPEDSTAQVTTARELEFALDAHESAELAEVDAALQRIKQGTYGQCHDCGEPIPAARLKAAPQAMRCISCQAKGE